MPVNVDGAHVSLKVRVGVELQATNVQFTNVSLGNVSTSLGSRNFQVSTSTDTELVGSCELSSSTHVVLVVQEDGGSLSATKSVTDGAAATADSTGAAGAGAALFSFTARPMVEARRAAVERPSTPRP
eukprot:scaffold3183_cov146-Skeletonema_marinoi.AAC.6